MFVLVCSFQKYKPCLHNLDFDTFDHLGQGGDFFCDFKHCVVGTKECYYIGGQAWTLTSKKGCGSADIIRFADKSLSFPS